MSELSTTQAKEKAKERDGYECRFCGVTREQHKEEYGRDVHAHHIIKDGNGGSDSVANLITVCRTCHNTLENTQAKALDRIRTEHTKELEQRVAALESELEEAREMAVEGPIPVYTWLDDCQVELNILVKGFWDPSISTYQTRERAVEAYAEYDGMVKMMTTKVGLKDHFPESVRVASTEDVDLHSAGTDISEYSEVEPVEPVETQFSHSDMDRVLEEGYDPEDDNPAITVNLHMDRDGVDSGDGIDEKEVRDQVESEVRAKVADRVTRYD